MTVLTKAEPQAATSSYQPESRGRRGPAELEQDAALAARGPPPHLCLLEQLDDESQPVREQLLQLQADDGQRQHGALELQQLVTGHAVQQLLAERRHVL